MLLQGCAGSAVGPVAAPVPVGGRVAPLAHRAASGKIQHVVVIVQENRSLDNLFPGFPGADTQAYGYNNQGLKIMLTPQSLAARFDVTHDSKAYFTACDGTGQLPGTNCKMDGFANEKLTCGSSAHPICPPANVQYAYVPLSETVPYWTMARRFVLADRMFASHIDASFVAHLYLVAGQAGSTVDFPNGAWGCDGGPNDTVPTLTQARTYGPRVQACFDFPTLGDELDAAGVSWKYYTSNITQSGYMWDPYQAIKHIRYGPDWAKNISTPQTNFFSDIDKGVLPAVSWVTPTCPNSDHSNCGGKTGPSWVASLVNKVGTSKYWNSTAIFVVWDDWGGWYDHVPPPFVDYDGLGFRVPLLVVSAYAKAGVVSHKQYEFGSILKFIEDQFGLARLAASDARANSPEPYCFNFTKPPRAFKKIPSQLGPAYFLSQPPDTRPVDDE
jgi:phospholipase C